MATQNDVLLDQVLRPSPPLAPRVLRAILAVVALVNLVFALSFVLRGAWPIAPFLGLDVALLAWAFRASTIAARREERVTLTPTCLSVARMLPKKPRREWTFNPYWVRVEMDTPHEHASSLKLWSHGKFLQIGAFLAPDERAAFAQRLKAALRNARDTAA
ncbi:MAG TPA: DUF2244 domain-containing protein [Rhizomicrobium sp.]|jgi:uncharacterized membrane protein|nr:DUF2244 domain-containing protein [Rhizomicrobium sp.]